MNNDVSKVQLGLPQVNSQAPKPEQKAEEKVVEAAPKAVCEDRSAQMMESLDAAAKWNAASLSVKPIDPSKYLTPERIADIEASMVVFDKGVKTHLGALKEEFGHLSEFDALSEADKLEMAAKSFAHSG